MNKISLAGCLKQLDLSNEEAAHLLSVDIRTIKRWLDGADEKIPGPVDQAIYAWLRLQHYGIPWKPHEISYGENQPDFWDQVVLFRKYAVQVSDILKRVEEKGGPSAPWEVNLRSRIATLGPLRISFDRLSNDNFSIAMYSRSDRRADLDRDRHLIEDAFACIAEKLAIDGWPQ